MELDRNLLKEFAKITNDSEVKTENKYLRGTIVENSGGKYVQIDGSSTTTPISEVVDVEEGDRVLVTIENHKATIIGNFTFPPSARKEQEALDKANSVEGIANTAQQKAQEANIKANTAVDQASIASASSNEAKQQASEALELANTVSENVNEAKDLATQASSDATEAKKNAADSLAAVSNANSEITRLNNEVASAKEDASTALEQLEEQGNQITIIEETYSTKAETEETVAAAETRINATVSQLQTTMTNNYVTKTDNVALEGRLQSQITQNAEGVSLHSSKIEKIEADTTEAQKDVAEALTKANAAQTAANTAQSKADEAKSAADTATANAQTAAEKATLAQNAATAATNAANAADKAVQEAKNDLDEAKNNLANVTSRVDATEADIAEAQGKVDAAQEAVNEALTDAAEARNVANTATEAANKAKQDAETAQGVANDAKTKANNAQTAADNAQAAANKAQQDVAALTSRVTTVEAGVKTNADNVAIYASKTEEIGTKVDNLKIGGRNLLYDDCIVWFDNKSTATIKDKSLYKTSGTIKITATNENQDVGFRYDKKSIYKPNTSYMLTYYVTLLEGELVGWGNFHNGKSLSFKECYLDGVKVKEDKGYPTSLIATTLNDKKKHKISVRFETGSTIPEDTGYNYSYIQPLRDNTANEVVGIQIDGFKMEEGNIATDWTPAPEDIQNDLNNLNNLNIGGRNYLLNSKAEKVMVKSSNVGGYNQYNWTSVHPLVNKSISESRTYTVSYRFVPAEEGFEPFQSFVVGCKNGGDAWSLRLGMKDFTIKDCGDYFHYSATFTVTGGTGSYLQSFIKFVLTENYDKAGGTVSHLKLEEGDRATDWTPAPEDMDNNLANNYYTKTETDAKLKVESDRVTSTVSKVTTIETTVNNIQIGGRNLVLNSHEEKSVKNYYVTYEVSDYAKTIFKKGDKFTISFDAKSDINGITIDAYTRNLTGGTGTRLNDVVSITNVGTSYKRYSLTITINSDLSLTNIAIRSQSNSGAGYNENATLTVKNVKMEKGNKSTDWTPSPEDTVNNIQIGGRNLQFDSQYWGNRAFRNTFTDVITINGEELTVPAGNADVNTMLVAAKKGEQFVFSIYIKGASAYSGNTFLIQEFDTSGNRTTYTWVTADVTTNWQRLHYVYTVKNDNAGYVNFGLRSASNVDNTYKLPKLEKGNKVTDWTPAPEDVDVIGGRNLAIGSKDTWSAWKTPGTGTNIWFDLMVVDLSNVILTTADYVTFQIVYEVSGMTAGSYYSQGQINGVWNGDNFFTNPIHKKLIPETTSNWNGVFKNSCTWSVSEKAVNLSQRKIHIGMRFDNANAEAKLRWKCIKVEIGNKATDWTPAPEDVQNGIDKVTTDFNNLKIGGRNLLLGVRTQDTSKGNYISGPTRTSETFLGCDVFKTGSAWNSIGFSLSRVIQDNNLKVGDKLTYSIYHKTDDTVGRNLVLYTSPASSDGSGSIGLYQDNNLTNTDWVRHVATFTISQLMMDMMETNSLRTRWEISTTSTSGCYQYYAAPKLELGNRVTDWTPAPEDDYEAATNAQNTADNAQKTADAVNTSVTEAHSLIQQLSDMIGNLVTDENGTSLMTQESGKWTFNIAGINDNFEAVQKAIKNIQDGDSETASTIASIKDLLESIENKTAYMTIDTDTDGKPRITLGKLDDPFKVVITNTSMDFMDGSIRVAYASNSAFYTEKLIVKNELQIGEGPGFVWRVRENGNMGLVYIS